MVGTTANWEVNRHWSFSRRCKGRASSPCTHPIRGISGGCCVEEPNSSNRHLEILLETPRDPAPVFHNPLRLTASSPTHARVRNASGTIQVNWQGISTLCARKDLNFEHPAAAGRSEDEWALIRSANVIMVACGSRVFSRTALEPQHPSSLGLLYCGTRAELPKSPELGNEVLASADSSVNRAAAFVAHERVAFVWL